MDPGGLDAVAPYIHDCWFDLSEMERSADGTVLTIPYARPPERWWLRFDSVRDVHVTDTEQIGRYDFNVLAYDPATSRIRVLTGVPLGLEVEVDSVHVTVERGERG